MSRRTRSFLTTTTGSTLGGNNKQVKEGKEEDEEPWEGKGDGGFRRMRGGVNGEKKSFNSPSVFQSSSLEERLATMGIDLGRNRSEISQNPRGSRARMLMMEGDDDDDDDEDEDDEDDDDDDDDDGGEEDDSSNNLTGRSSGHQSGISSGFSHSSRSLGIIGAGSGSKREEIAVEEGEALAMSGRKSARLSKDISRRISEISTSMDQYDKSVKNVNETIQEAYRKTIQDQKRNKQEHSNGGGGLMMRSRTSSPGMMMGGKDAFLLKQVEQLSKTVLGGEGLTPQQIVGLGLMGAGDNAKAAVVHRKDQLAFGRDTPRKVFGLDPTSLLKTSSDEEDSSSEAEDNNNKKGRRSSRNKKKDDDVDKPASDSEESSSDDDEVANMRVSIQSQKRPTKSATLKRLEENLGKNPGALRAGRSKLTKKNRKSLSGRLEDFVPRSLSPIMPSLPDKQFKTMLERREERVTRHLNSMKDGLAQLNQKVEMDKRKAERREKKQQHKILRPDNSRAVGVGGGGSGTGSARGSTQTSYKGRPLRLMKAKPDKALTNEFSEFVQTTGGKAGGWEGKDHTAFLKTFEIWRGHPMRLMEALKKDLPHKRAPEIAAHINWYERFLQLESKNKANVHKWSQKKRKENELVYQMSSASNRAKLEGEKRRQEHLQRIREQERDRNKEKLALWKRTQHERPASSVGPDGEEPVRDRASSTAFSISRRQQRPKSSYPLLHQIGPTSDKAAAVGYRSILKTPDSDMGLDPSSPTTGGFDIAGVRQHILEITAKVHALDNPKREFRPPPLPVLPSLPKTRGGGGVGKVEGSLRNSQESLPHPKKSVVSTVKVKGGNVGGGGGDAAAADSRPVQIIQEGKNQARRLSELREKDERLMEAKKKAIQIARERRKSNLSQISAEEIRRRIRAQTNLSSSSSPSTILNPTKQSELRKSLTHLKRLELLSREDLKRSGASPVPGGLAPLPHLDFPAEGSIFDPKLFPSSITNVSRKNVPRWRQVDSPSPSLGNNFHGTTGS